MNTTNRTRIAMIVKSLFTMGLDSKISNMETVPFIPDGVIADQEYIAERQKVEAALRLGAARIRKRKDK